MEKKMGRELLKWLKYNAPGCLMKSSFVIMIICDYD